MSVQYEDKNLVYQDAVNEIDKLIRKLALTKEESKYLEVITVKKTGKRPANYKPNFFTVPATITVTKTTKIPKNYKPNFILKNKVKMYNEIYYLVEEYIAYVIKQVDNFTSEVTECLKIYM